MTEWKGGGWEAFTLQKNEMTTFQCSAVSRTNLKRLRNCGKMRSTWTSTNDMLPSIISFNAYSATSSNTSAVMPNRRQSLLIFLVLLQLTGKTLDNCNITCLLLNSNGTNSNWLSRSKMLSFSEARRPSVVYHVQICALRQAAQIPKTNQRKKVAATSIIWCCLIRNYMEEMFFSQIIWQLCLKFKLKNPRKRD